MALNNVNTLVTLHDELEIYCNSHYQIQRFKFEFEEQLENFSTEGKEFPILYAVPQSFGKDGMTDIHTIRIYVLSRLNRDRDNTLDNVNDTSLILNDTIKYWNSSNRNSDILLTNDPIGTPVNNSQLDYLQGYYADFDFELKSYSRCDIPIPDGVPRVGASGSSYIEPFLTCSSLGDCVTFTNNIDNLQNQINNLDGEKWTLDVDLDGTELDFTRNDGSTYSVDLQPLIDQLETDVLTNSNDISTNTNDISNLELDLSGATSSILTNSNDISTNQTNIGNNLSLINTNITNIGTNETDISNLVIDVSDNLSLINTNITDINNLELNLLNYLPLSGGTITGDLSIGGNLEVLGSATTIDTETIQAKDNNFTLNYGGTHLSADGGGITIEDGVANGSDSSWLINSDGNWYTNQSVGIGTSTPRDKFDVTTTGTENILLGTGGSGVARAFLMLQPSLSKFTFNNTNGDRGFEMRTNSGSVNGSVGSTFNSIAGPFSMGVNSGSQDLVIDSAGLVGVGTTSPNSPLEIKSSAGEKLRLTDSDAGTPANYMSFYDSDGRTGGLGAISSGTDNINLWNETSTGAFTISTDGTNNPRLYIESGGRVGIGTDTPSTELQVLSDSFIVADFTRTTSLNPSIRLSNVDDGGLMNIGAISNGDGYINTTSGRLGVNNTTPTEALDIVGNIKGSAEMNINDLLVVSSNSVYNSGPGGILTSTFFGINSGLVNTGVDNAGFGYNSLWRVTTGFRNVAVGKDALYRNTTGSSNFGLGWRAGGGITTGNDNVLIGTSANEVGNPTRNIGIGRISLFTNNGDRHIAIGFQAGRFAGTGSTAFSQGSDCIFIGDTTRASGINVENEIAIGKDAIGRGSNTTTLGNDDTTETHLRGELHVDIERWTIDLMAATTKVIYASESLSITLVEDIVNAPTTTILLNGSAYTLGDPIVSGDKIDIIVSTTSVIKLKIEK